MQLPTATTHLAAVIGQPVRHSLSPTLHNAAFAALRLDWVYVAFEVDAGGAVGAIEAMRALGIEGLSVTMPHKADVAAAVDQLSPVAARLGAVNCVRREATSVPGNYPTDGSNSVTNTSIRQDYLLVGENTDGEGFLRSLAEDASFDPAGRRCVVLGAGGAARAVILALAGAGASDIGVVNRTPERARSAAALAGEVGRVVAADAVAKADLIVNATPVGMAGGGVHDAELPLDPELLSPGQVVADLIYHPDRTPLLEAATFRRAVAVNGLGMLLHQAGLAFELWTGEPAPISAMRAAVLDELARRSAGAPEHKP
jgi:shikimate dehydrogenase